MNEGTPADPLRERLSAYLADAIEYKREWVPLSLQTLREIIAALESAGKSPEAADVRPPVQRSGGWPVLASEAAVEKAWLSTTDRYTISKDAALYLILQLGAYVAMYPAQRGAVQPPSDDRPIDECARCGKPMSFDELEPTEVCNNCAQEFYAAAMAVQPPAPEPVIEHLMYFADCLAEKVLSAGSRNAAEEEREALRDAIVSALTPPSIAQRGAALTDAARLDWIGNKLFVKSWGGTLGVPSTWRVAEGDWRRLVQSMRGETFREAIDAALALSPEDAGKPEVR